MLGKKFTEGDATIYELEDCFIIILEVGINTMIYYSSEIDEAKRIAADKLFEYTHF